MSTTAGLGSQDYVAVNVTSVVAVLFGLASLLAIASPVLLVFPIVGVVLEPDRLRQVRNSNGTQTGKGLAILGLVLSGIITAVNILRSGIAGVCIAGPMSRRWPTSCQKYGELAHPAKIC